MAIICLFANSLSLYQICRPSSEYSIKETSLNVTIHSPPESCTFSLGDRQTVTTSGAMLDGWQVNHPWALSRVSPLSKKNQKNWPQLYFFAFHCSLPNSFIYSHQRAQFASDWTLRAVDIPIPIFSKKIPHKADLKADISSNISRLAHIESWQLDRHMLSLISWD